MHSPDDFARQYYRVYLYDHAGSIGLARDVEAGSDEEASRIALSILCEQSLYIAVEVWQRARRICRHTA